MTNLVGEMTDRDPAKRPTMNQVLLRYADILRTLSSSTLRSRVSGADEDTDILLRISRQAGYIKRRIKYTLLRVPPVPNSISST